MFSTFVDSSLKWLECEMQIGGGGGGGGESSDEDGGAVALTLTGFVSLIVLGLLVNSFVNLRLV